MIFDLLLLIGIYFVKLIAYLLPDIDVIPTAFHSAIVYFFSAIYKFNIFVPIDTLLIAVKVLVGFFSAYYSAVIIIKIIGFLWRTKLD